MLELHLEGDVEWIQKHVCVCLVVRKDRVGISGTKKTSLSNLTNEVTRTVCRDSTFVDFMMIFI